MRVLFVPVSSKKGIGEYMRSLILAEAIEREWPGAQIHFALSQEAPYLHSCPYPTLVTKRSPTHHVTEVNQYITDIKPEVVIFDASGRAAQIKHAKQSGSITVFIAQHDKKIRKGMRLTRLLYTDLFWIAQPIYTVSKLTRLQKLKLRFLNKANPIYLGCVFSPPTPAQEDSFLASLNLKKQDYVFVSAGSGGHFMQDGSLAAEGFHQALSHSHNTSQIVQVWGNNYPNEIPKNNSEINLQVVKNTEFIILLKNAKYALINGCSGLIQMDTSIRDNRSCLV